MATVRVRKHVNPLKSELQVVVPPLDWAAIFADPQRPLMVDIGCGETFEAEDRDAAGVLILDALGQSAYGCSC